MSGVENHYAGLGRELSTQLQRRDGESLAKMLHERLEQDLQTWFYDRILPAFDSVAIPSWTDQARFLSDLHGRNEISCFQAIESASVAHRLGYVPSDKLDWFVDWSLRLNLGVRADEAKANRLPSFWNATEKMRVEFLARMLSDALPRTAFAETYLQMFGPTLVHATRATVANVFGDKSTAEAARTEYDQLDAYSCKVLSHGHLSCL